MIESYEITNVRNVRDITISFSEGIDVTMPSPAGGKIQTYRVFELVATYIDDLPATWRAGVTKVFKTTPTPTRPSIMMRSIYFEKSIREDFDKIVQKCDIRDNRPR